MQYVAVKSNKTQWLYSYINTIYINFTGVLLIGMEVATPAESARTEDPGPSFTREAAERGTKTKNATHERNVFETNVLLASAESVHRNGNQHIICLTFSK